VLSLLLTRSVRERTLPRDRRRFRQEIMLARDRSQLGRTPIRAYPSTNVTTIMESVNKAELAASLSRFFTDSLERNARWALPIQAIRTRNMEKKAQKTASSKSEGKRGVMVLLLSHHRLMWISGYGILDLRVVECPLCVREEDNNYGTNMV